MNIHVGDEVFRITVDIRPDVERRIVAMLGKMDKAIAEAFAEFLVEATSDDAMNDLVELLAEGLVEQAIDFVSRYSRPVALRIAEALRAAGEFEVLSLRPQAERARTAAGGAGMRLPPSIAGLVDRTPKPSVGISFDPAAPRAVEAMRTIRDEFLSAFNASQREVIGEVVTRGLQEGTGTREVARQVRQVIGLTKVQTGALERYAEALRNGSAEALTSPTRDRRYDATVRKAIRDGRALTERQIADMVEARRRKMLRQRADTIALNESAKALSMGREEGLRQMVEAAGIDPATVTREWRSLRDSRVRDTHIVMDGQKVGMEAVFVSPSGARLRYPRDPQAPAHETVNCRCFTIHRIGGKVG